MAQEQKRGEGFTKLPEVGKTPTTETGTAPDPSNILAKLEGKVKVIHGANDDTFEGLVGKRVSAVRASLVDAFNIPGDALVLVNGQQVNGDHILTSDSVLEFIKQAGVKGKLVILVF